ncbi:MAG TPA: bile acid:sodium symporter family protein [Candidatus Angelobacter sp.]|nr:bile acid:sodium symporter family protein [Candidatus Angelobacter sp.]
MSSPPPWQLAIVCLLIALAVGLRFSKALRGYQFTVWILAAVAAAMVYPDHILHIGGVDMRNKWLLLIIVQLVMFGMGTQMSLKDFSGVVKSPRGVLVGIVCHFSVMPLVGLALTKMFHFPPEIAAGIILIGSCSSGLASNVMAYIAKSNLALSVTVTAITTMLAPLMTPLWMKLLAGQFIEVKFFSMMMEIIKIVLVPIGAALLHDYLKHASPRGCKTVRGIAVFGAAWLVFIAGGGWRLILATAPQTLAAAIGVFGFLLAAVVAGVVFHWLTQRFDQIEKWMPKFSMFGIVYFTLVTTAAGRDSLLKIGGLLFLAAMLHNAAGYVFGYWLSRASGLDKHSARSVAFEVGLQNGSMASGVASAMNMLGTMGLAAAIFSPWMNVSGSVLANYWCKRPVKTKEEGATEREKVAV